MIILITGTSRGIGKYLAGRFIEAGHTVIGFCRSECDIVNKNFYYFPADVTDEKAVVRALGEVRKQFGYIDVLINNAGIAAMNHFCLTPVETAKRVMNVNFFGTFLMTRE